MSINERIKQIREVLGLTQQELAFKLKIGQSTIADVEKGRIYPNQNYVKGLHEIFDINLNWLICGSGKMKNQINFVEEPESIYKKNNDEIEKSLLLDMIKLLEENKTLMEEKLKRYLVEIDAIKKEQSNCSNNTKS